MLDRRLQRHFITQKLELARHDIHREIVVTFMALQDITVFFPRGFHTMGSQGYSQSLRTNNGKLPEFLAAMQ